MSEMTGMMWFDDQGGSVEQQLGRAKNYYAHKTGKHPKVAWVSFSMVAKECVLADMRVIPSKLVARNNIWLGAEEK